MRWARTDDSRATNTDVSRMPVRLELVDRRAGEGLDIGDELGIEGGITNDALDVSRREILLLG